MEKKKKKRNNYLCIKYVFINYKTHNIDFKVKYIFFIFKYVTGFFNKGHRAPYFFKIWSKKIL